MIFVRCRLSTTGLSLAGKGGAKDKAPVANITLSPLERRLFEKINEMVIVDAGSLGSDKGAPSHPFSGIEGVGLGTQANSQLTRALKLDPITKQLTVSQLTFSTMKKRTSKDLGRAKGIPPIGQDAFIMV